MATIMMTSQPHTVSIIIYAKPLKSIGGVGVIGTYVYATGADIRYLMIRAEIH